MKKNERIGLVIIAASLLVIALIIALLFGYQQRTKEDQIRSQGLGLIRLLTSLPPDQLLQNDSENGILKVIKYSDQDSSLAYLTLENTAGVRLREVVSAGIIVPVRADTSMYTNEKQYTLKAGKDILEFSAPFIINGQAASVIRIGYFKPGFGLSVQQIPFFASIALPIFLLVPLFYFYLKREIRPLHDANEKIEGVIRSGLIQEVKLEASGELSDFMSKLNGFIKHAQNRIEELEGHKEGLVTSSKLLSYQRARVENVLQAMPDGVLIIDETGLVNFSNAKIGHLLGVDASSIVGTKPADWCTNPDIIAFFTRSGGARSQNYSSESLEFSPGNALETIIQITSYPLFSPKDTSEIFGTLIVFRDITVEKLAKKSRGEFVAHVAHELKTPLNVLSMYAEALQGEDGKDEGFKIEAVNVINDEVERLSTLISNLLSITKIEMGSLNIDRQRIRLHELLQDTMENVARSGKGMALEFKLDLPKEITPISADKDLLRVAINNLLTNAIKYNQQGGTVTLSVNETTEAINIIVSDTGIGIAKEDQDKIFEKFYRSNEGEVRERTGHGLGLSLARDIVHLHNGHLTVDSTLGKGTEFTINIQKSTGLMKQAI